MTKKLDTTDRLNSYFSIHVYPNKTKHNLVSERVLLLIAIVAEKALVSLRICVDSPEPSLLPYT